MGIINLDDVRPGMILDADVKDDGGRTLLAGGNEITEKHLKIFKMWGVTEASVRGIEKEELEKKSTAELDPVLLQEAEEEARKLFRHTSLDNPVTKELFRLFTLRKVKEKSNGQSHDQQAE